MSCCRVDLRSFSHVSYTINYRSSSLTLNYFISATSYFSIHFCLMLGVLVDFTQRVYKVNEDEYAVVKVHIASGIVVSPIKVR